MNFREMTTWTCCLLLTSLLFVMFDPGFLAVVLVFAVLLAGSVSALVVSVFSARHGGGKGQGKLSTDICPGTISYKIHPSGKDTSKMIYCQHVGVTNHLWLDAEEVEGRIITDEQ